MKNELNIIKRIPFAIFIFITFQVMGQFILSPTIYYGKSNLYAPKTRHNLDANFKETYTTKFKNSYELGVASDYAFKKWFSMQFGVFYDQLNSHLDYQYSEMNNPSFIYYYNDIRDYKVNYLSIPIAMGFQYRKLSLNLGYQTAFMLSNHTNFQTGSTYNNPTIPITQIYLSDTIFRKTNISFVMGVSYEVAKNFHIKAKITRGLSELLKPAYPIYRTRSIQFLFGVSYDIHFNHKSKDEKGK